MISLFLRLRHGLLIASFLFVLLVPFGVVAQEQASSNQAIAHGFAIDGNADNFVGGALVSGKDNNATTVQLAASDTASRLVGVVSILPLVSLSNGDPQVRVATSGTVDVLVSTINGDIRSGDKITASPIAGVGMLATGSYQIVGTAQEALNKKAATTQVVRDTKGGEHTVYMGRVPVQIGVSFYQAPTNGIIPPVIQGVANNIAGRPVSVIRILVCSILLLLSVVGTAVFLYAVVRSGLTSLGRNPMAAGAIRRSIIQAALVALAVLGLVLLASYIILTV